MALGVIKKYVTVDMEGGYAAFLYQAVMNLLG